MIKEDMEHPVVKTIVRTSAKTITVIFKVSVFLFLFLGSPVIYGEILGLPESRGWGYFHSYFIFLALWLLGYVILTANKRFSRGDIFTVDSSQNIRKEGFYERVLYIGKSLLFTISTLLVLVALLPIVLMRTIGYLLNIFGFFSAPALATFAIFAPGVYVYARYRERVWNYFMFEKPLNLLIATGVLILIFIFVYRDFIFY